LKEITWKQEERKPRNEGRQYSFPSKLLGSEEVDGEMLRKSECEESVRRVVHYDVVQVAGTTGGSRWTHFCGEAAPGLAGGATCASVYTCGV